jgi:hypothetical protein
MRNFFLSFVCVFFSLFCTGILFGQNSDSIINKDTLKKHDHLLSIGIVTSPLFHTNNSKYNPEDIFSIPTGLSFSLRIINKTIIGIETGLMFDPKKYSFNYCYSLADTNHVIYSEHVKFEYHYVYIPILINLYFKNSFLSIGGVIRRPVCFQSEYKNWTHNNLSNPYSGFQIGFSKSISINKANNLIINPYLIYFGKGIDSYGKLASYSATKSSGLLFGINLRLAHIIKF